jgi:RND family efflux transporter MFP subunit
MPPQDNSSGLSALKIDPALKTQTARKKPVVWIVTVAGLLILLGFLATFIKDQPIEIETATIQKYLSGQGLTVLNASGYVEPKQRATVAAKITGQVTEMLVDEGMRVEKDQVLARLDDAEAKARLRSAQAQLSVSMARIPEMEIALTDAERDLSRIIKLHKKGIASQEDLDKAAIAVDRYKAQLHRSQVEVGSAEAQVKVSQQDLENFTIRAPFSGIIVSKDAQVGEIVSPISAGGGFTRTGIATIVNMDSLEIEVDVNEAYIANVLIGQKVIATLDSYPEWKLPASVRTVIPTADRQKATVKVRIAFDKLDPKILPDMGVKVAFMSEAAKHQETTPLSIAPKNAVKDSDGTSVVFVLNRDSVERRSVKTGRAIGSTIEILAGLRPGEQVVTSSTKELKDGQKIEIKR